MPFLTSDRWRRKAGAAGSLPDDGLPRVFVEKVRGAARLSAVDSRARSCGLVPGMALTDARARIPGVRAAAAQPAADAAYLEQLADRARAVTPSVALDLPDGLALDITGCAHLFGGEDRLAARLTGILRAAGASLVRLAVAPTPDMARALARFAPASPCFAVDGAQARALPVAALECAGEDTRALRRAGLETIGAVADRPSVLFTARFTQAFTTRLARVLGEEDRRIVPLRPLAPVLAERRCAEPVVCTEAIGRILSELAAVVCEELRARGEGGRAFEATFLRTDGAVRRLHVETSKPVADPSTILRLYHHRLDALADPLDPGFGFDLIRVEAVHAEPAAACQVTLDAHEQRDEQVAGLVDRLGAMFGRERIARLRSVDTHIPERAQLVAPAAGDPGPLAGWSGPGAPGEAPARPLLLYERPHPIEIETDEAAAPVLLRWRRLVHRITAAEGPERIAPEWWRAPSGYGTRDYYRVESGEGRRFWIFRADATGSTHPPRWFLHGVFA